MWNSLWDNFKYFFTDGIAGNYVAIIIEFIMLALGFYYLYRVFKANKADNFVYIFTIVILAVGLVYAFTRADNGGNVASSFIALAVIAGITLLMYTDRKSVV